MFIVLLTLIYTISAKPLAESEHTALMRVLFDLGCTDSRCTRFPLGQSCPTNQVYVCEDGAGDDEYSHVISLSFSATGDTINGVLSPSVGDLSHLTRLYFSNIQVEGVIPETVCEPKKLGSLYFSGTKVGGSIPASMAECNSLTSLRLHNNKLNGTFPAFLAQLPQLASLNLGNNELTGTLPSELSKNRVLDQFEVHQNHLRGTIPALSARRCSVYYESTTVTRTNCFAACADEKSSCCEPFLGYVNCPDLVQFPAPVVPALPFEKVVDPGLPIIAIKKGTKHSAIVRMGDFNGDDISDYLFVPRDEFEILLGDFSLPKHATLLLPIESPNKRVSWSASRPSSYAFGDFNGDGRMDVVINSRNNGERKLQCVLGKNVTGVIDLNGELSFNIAAGPHALSNWSLDVDGDNRTDFFALQGTPLLLHIFFGTDDRANITSSIIQLTGTRYDSHQSVGDVNGDGVEDFALSDQDATSSTGQANAGRVYILFGGEHWRQNQTLSVEDIGTKFPGVILDGDLNDQVLIAAAGRDVNGDGVDDMVLLTVEGNAYVVFGNKTLSDANPINLPSVKFAGGFMVNIGGGDRRGSAQLADLNDDGLADVCIFSKRSFVVFGERTSKGRVVDVVTLDGSNGFAVKPTNHRFPSDFAQVTADWNRDGVEDVLFTRAGHVRIGAYLPEQYALFGRKSKETHASTSAVTATSAPVASSPVSTLIATSATPLSKINRTTEDVVTRVDANESAESGGTEDKMRGTSEGGVAGVAIAIAAVVGVAIVVAVVGGLAWFKPWLSDESAVEQANREAVPLACVSAVAATRDSATQGQLSF